MALEDTIQLDQQAASADITQVEQSLPPDLFDYEKAKVQINLLIGEWSPEFQKAEERRLERYMDVDVESLRARGDLAPDETFIPDRVIDNNIVRENSDIMTFLNSGQRLAVFHSLSNPNQDTRQLEDEITKGLTYNGWYRELNRTADGALLHGQDYLEVVFDATKPLHVGFEHVSFDRFIYNKKCASIQDSERVGRKYEITVNRLEEFARDFEFDQATVLQLIEDKEGAKRTETICIWKIYFRYNKCIYSAWFSEKGLNWLKAPTKLQLGIYDEAEVPQVNELTGEPVIDPMTGEPVMGIGFVVAELDIYPIFCFLYRDDEQETLSDHKGRAFLDAPQQEANTAIISSFVNGVVKSSVVYASVEEDDGESAEMAQLIELIPNGIYRKPIQFFSKPAPEVSVLSALQLLDTKNSESTGKIAAAVSNRKDSRKTATELQQAGQEETKITSTKLATFSEFWREVLTFGWRIIQSQALQDKIPLLLKEQPTGDEIGSVQLVNDKFVISQQFEVRPAGDTDVIMAQQEMAKFQEDWPVFQTIPGLAPVVLKDYI